MCQWFKNESYGRGYGRCQQNYVLQKKGILKWTLNRPVQTKNTNALMALPDVKG